MSDPLEQQRREARRRVAREHHPDRGGSVDTYLRLLRQVDEAHTASPSGRVPTIRRTASGRVSGWLRRVGAGTRRLRSFLPTQLPGSRRFGSLS